MHSLLPANQSDRPTDCERAWTKPQKCSKRLTFNICLNERRRGARRIIVWRSNPFSDEVESKPPHGVLYAIWYCRHEASSPHLFYLGWVRKSTMDRPRLITIIYDYIVFFCCCLVSFQAQTRTDKNRRARIYIPECEYRQHDSCRERERYGLSFGFSVGLELEKYPAVVIWWITSYYYSDGERTKRLIGLGCQKIYIYIYIYILSGKSI